MTDVAGLSEGPGVAQVHHFWAEFELEDFRSQLDERGLAVAEKQEASIASRRKLAETTKEFKRSADAETVRKVGALLKQYQAEIDQLTARAKFGESAFLDVYQKLYEAPDPAPALAAALELASRGAELEAANTKMAQELAEYQAESKELKNQGGTIRRLEERVRALEAQVQERDHQLAEAAATLEAAGNSVAAQETAEREAALVAQLAEAEASLRNLKTLHEASQKQLFSMQSRSEEEQAVLQSELEVATAEMERAQQRLMALEQEQGSLQAKAGREAARQPAQPQARPSDEGLRRELSAQRELVTRLHSELAAVSTRAEEEAGAWASRCEGLRAALAAQEARSEALESELAGRPSSKQVEDLRQQLRLLQAVGFGAVEAEEAGAPGGPGAMEALLLGKARKLEHELTTTRLRLAEVSGEAEAAGVRIAELESEAEASAALIARLEEDLLAARPAEGPGPAAAQANGVPDLDSEDGLGLGPDSGGGRTMVSVLAGQRDRLRARCSELEEALAQAMREAKGLRRELEAARADNVALVERLRYVQGYQTAGRSRTDVEAGDIESRYARDWEERMNPFSDWREQEKASRRRQLNVADRLMLEFGHFVSSSQRARVFVVVYSVALHLMIMWVLARWGHGPAHHISGSELQLLCHRHGHEAGDIGEGLVDASFGTRGG